MEKTELLNKFFSSCFSPPTASIPSTQHRAQHTSSNISSQHKSSGGPLSTIECTQEEIEKLLSTYRLQTATGPDGISSKMLRSMAESISPHLTALFNLSLRLGIVADDWKMSNVTPIHKGGEVSAAANYRPISLLSLVSKVLERVIHNRVTKYLTANALLSKQQFGFRSGFSTQEALLVATNDWHNLLSNHQQVGAVFFDIKKAFDSVPHNQVITSLASKGIAGPLLFWFSDYLTNR